MSFRIRSNNRYPSGEKVYKLKGAEEVHYMIVQQMWDEENRDNGTGSSANRTVREIRNEAETKPEDLSSLTHTINDKILYAGDERCFIMRPAILEISSIYPSVEYAFSGFSYSFKLQRQNDVAWWSFDEVGYSKSRYLPQLGPRIPGGYLWRFYKHDFFQDYLIVSMRSDNFNRFESISSRFDEKLQFIGKDPNYVIRIYLSRGMQGSEAGRVKYIEIYVEKDTKILSIFEVLGGWKLIKDASLTQLFLNKERSIGKQYTLKEALRSKAQMKDSGWVIEEGVVRLLPAPSQFQECITTA